MTKFIHTSDWQLGMRRSYLSDVAQTRFTDERFSGIERIRNIASERGCDFVVVAGDVFETNHPDRETLVRAFDAMRSDDVVFYLLPGNHDAINAGSVYRSPEFRANCPENVRVLDEYKAYKIDAEVEIIAAPLTSNRPLSDAIADVGHGLEESANTIRILVAHGQFDSVMGIANNPADFNLTNAERLIETNLVSYIAVGDRHSVLDVGATGRIWYSGAHVATSRRENDPNQVLVVEINSEGLSVEKVQVGQWFFVSDTFRLESEEDVRQLKNKISSLPNKQNTVVRLELQGVLDLKDHAVLEQSIQDSEHLFAGIRRPQDVQDLHIRPSIEDLEAMDLSGFATETYQALQDLANEDQAGQAPSDALSLLYRLAQGQI